MQIDFVLQGKLNQTASQDLRSLHDYLRNADVPAELAVMSMPKVKEALVIGLAVASLAVTSIGVIISALSLWQSERPGYSVTIHSGELNYELSNLDKKQALEITKKLEKPAHRESLIVRISQK